MTERTVMLSHAISSVTCLLFAQYYQKCWSFSLRRRKEAFRKWEVERRERAGARNKALGVGLEENNQQCGGIMKQIYHYHSVVFITLLPQPAMSTDHNRSFYFLSGYGYFYSSRHVYQKRKSRYTGRFLTSCSFHVTRDHTSTPYSHNTST